MISIIVAMDENGCIGAENRLPWHLPDDMKWFVEKTMGKPVILGRKTYDSIPAKFKPLSGRQNIVITRNRDYQAPGAEVVFSLEAAIAAAGRKREIVIAGGTQIYEQSLSLASRLYLTLVVGAFTGDAYFPPYDRGQWAVEYRQEHPVDERHAHAFTWLILEKRST